MATRTDKNGTVWNVDAQGNPVSVAGGGQSNTIITKRADPYARPKAGAELTGENLNNTGKGYDNQIAAATLSDVVRKAKADADKAEMETEALRNKYAKRGDMDPTAKLAGILKSIDDIAIDAKDNGGWFETGTSGYGLGHVPGTAAYDLQRKIDKIDANSAFSELQQMRENSPTGGALGGIAVEELKMLKSTVATLDSNMSQDEFLGQLQTARDHYSGLIGRIDPENKYATSIDYKNDNIAAAVKEGTRANENNGGGGATKTGNNGFDRYVTDKDNEFHSAVTGRFKSGANTAQIRQFINQSGYGSQYLDADIANAVAHRDGTGSYARQGPQRGAAFQKPETGQRSLTQQVMGEVANSDAGHYGGAALSAATMGFDDELVGAAFGDRAGQMAQYGKDYAREESPWLSLAGDISGGAALGGPLTAGARYLGIKGAQAASPFAANMAAKFAGSMPKAAVSAATMQGALTGAGTMNDNRLLGAGIGGAAGLAGGYVGGKVFGAATEGGFNPGRKVANNVRGLFNGRQRALVPSVDKPSQMISKSVEGNFDNVLSQLGEAQGFGLPMTLADTDPSLRSLAGATTRRSPEAMGIAENALIPRQRGQYDRLLGAIDRDLGPTANIPQHSDDLIKKARADSKPFYDAYEAAPGASSVDVSGIVKTPMGLLGLQNAGKRVQNRLGPDGQPVDPQSLGFDFDDAGELVLGKTPSFQTLDLMKKGLDDVINDGYDPITRQYTADATAAIALKKNLVGQIDHVNPHYPKARAAYEGPAGERQAFQQGADARTMTPDQEAFNLQGMSAPKQQQYRMGRISDMVDQAGKVRYASNPWENAHGTPQAQQRIGAMFPEGAPNFGRQYELEGQMARTNKDITGGSATAGRIQADADFAPGMLQTAALDAATGSPGIMSMARLGGKLAGGELGRIGAKKKADALAPILFDADPAKNAAIIRKLQSTIKGQNRGKGLIGNKSRRLGSMAGGAGSVGLSLGFAD